MNEIINFYKKKKIESDINYQMKYNIENNNFDLSLTKQKIQNKLNIQTNEINELITILKMSLNKSIINEKKENEIDNFKNFKIENMKNINTLNINEKCINCLKILDDGRLAIGDDNSDLIIYNIKTFKSDIIIKNNLSSLCNFIQLNNKNIACSFDSDNSLKIIKIKNNKEYEDIQIINNAHNNYITKMIELKNENLITFSQDCYFKIWKLNNNNQYEKIYEFEDNNSLSDGLEIKDNEIILYALNTNPQSLVFYNLNKKKN